MKSRALFLLAVCTAAPSTPAPATASIATTLDRCASGKYVINEACWRDPDAGACADESIVDGRVALHQLHAQVERPSPGLQKNGHAGFRKFHGAFVEEGPVDGRAVRGGYTATYPRQGSCDPGAYRQPFPMTGTFVMRGGERYLELVYPYRSFDTTACELSGAATERRERWYRVAPRGVARLDAGVTLSAEMAWTADRLADDLTCRAGATITVVEAQRSPAAEAARALALLDAAWAEPLPDDGPQLASWLKQKKLVNAPADVEVAARRLGVPGELLREGLRGKPGELLPEELRKALAERRFLDDEQAQPALFRPLRERYFALRDEPGARRAALTNLVGEQAASGQYLTAQMHPRALAVDLAPLSSAERRELVALVGEAGGKLFDERGAFVSGAKEPAGTILRFVP